MPGTLYVVATPIGNLEDLTLRAIRVLREVDAIACEDTRVTRKLLEHLELHKPLLSHHAHSTERDIESLLERLGAGDNLALVSDAGTPGLSDPGAPLVAEARARGIAVVPIPGPSAAITALSASGLPAQRVLFVGFLPRSRHDRREALAPFRNAPCTLIIYEAANRVVETLEDLLPILGDRPACVARELTKRFETFVPGTVSTLAAHFRNEAPRGEVVLLIAPPELAAQENAALDLRTDAQRLIAQGERPAEIARLLAHAHGIARKEAYRLVLELLASP